MALDGGQAEYVRVPFADSTLEFIPEEVRDEMMIIMCDIFPTGYYGAMKAITKLMRNTQMAESIVGGTLHAPSALRPAFQKIPLDESGGCLSWMWTSWTVRNSLYEGPRGRHGICG
jgi:hypothetical protein